MLNFSQTHKSIGFCLCLVFCLTSLIKLQSKQLSQKLSTKNLNTYIEQEKHQQTTAVLQKKLPAFGYDNLLADWTYLQFLQYFGDSKARRVTGYSVVTDYFETIVKHDPHFVQSYFAISSANSLFAARPEKTVELINQVLQVITPQHSGYPFYLWTYKATDEILFLGDLKAAKYSYKTAAKWARAREDDLGNEVAKNFDRTADFLASNPDPTKSQIGAWMTVLSSTKDRKTQNYVHDQLKKLGAEITIDPTGRIDIKLPQQAGT